MEYEIANLVGSVLAIGLIGFSIDSVYGALATLKYRNADDYNTREELVRELRKVQKEKRKTISPIRKLMLLAIESDYREVLI